MSVFPLKHSVLPATVLAGAVFSSLTVPLAIFGSEPVDIQLGQEPVFSGTIKDLAAPYVGVVGILSVGMGVAGVAIAGWQQSSRKSEHVEAKLSNLQRTLEEKELHLQAAMLSEQRLQTSGLDFFLQDETSANPAVDALTTETQSMVATTKVPVASTPVAHTQSSSSVLDAEPTQAAVQSVVSTLSAAQAFLSFARSNVAVSANDDGQSIAKPSAANITLQELQDQLKQIMSQVETLRGSLDANAQPVHTPQLRQQNYAVSAPSPLQHRPVAQPQWVLQQVAS
ncbi:MAG: hypothetical protein KME45_11185 [Stenomitos rutilans HA7619-LM2]|jgi:hypothetical protein|nr:hypothetical protein [Stenomitos rutilans HA7619-LM2]